MWFLILQLASFFFLQICFSLPNMFGSLFTISVIFLLCSLSDFFQCHWVLRPLNLVEYSVIVTDSNVGQQNEIRNQVVQIVLLLFHEKKVEWLLLVLFCFFSVFLQTHSLKTVKCDPTEILYQANNDCVFLILPKLQNHITELSKT